MEQQPLAIEEIERIVRDWYEQGILTDIDRESIKAEYLRQFGVETCTMCPNFWNNVQTHFRLFLRAHNRLKNMSVLKYMIPLTIGSVYVAGVGLIVNPGVKSPGTVELTDKLAADLLDKFPDLGNENIVKNPEYNEADAKAKVDAKVKKQADTKAKAKKDTEGAGDATNTDATDSEGTANQGDSTGENA